MSHAWTLTLFRLRLAMRNRAFLVFGIIVPLAFLFLFSAVFARNGGPAVAYVLASVLAMSVMGSFWGLSQQLVIFREQGILRRFRLTPLGPGTMLVSSIISNLILMIPGIAAEIAVAHWVLHMQALGNLLSVFVLSALGAATFATLGLVVASVANSMMETQVINQLLWLSFLLLSGVAIPLPSLPVWLQKVALYLPATYLVTGLERALIEFVPLNHLGAELASLGGSSLLAFFVCQQIFRWEPEEKMPRQAKLWVAAALVPFLLLGAWETKQGGRLSEARSILHNTFAERPAQRTAPTDAPAQPDAKP
ncbi:MAG TPA: ABC transporter permease [Candidatus Acidoferrales bacterium]|nr:ABC transporter permease [Candidatus Acidoferrales bacterium]